MISHKKIEKNSILMLVLVLIVVSIGGLVEIAPLFYLESTIEKVKGMRPRLGSGGGRESMYDHPFQWGSKRTGPDLARVGGRYSDEGHVTHMKNPRDVVPESVMPGYPFLATTQLRVPDIQKSLEANRAVGVPYSDEMVENAARDLRMQVNPDADDIDAFMERYPKAQVRNFDGNPAMVSELDALIAYLQMLGTLVDFTSYDVDANKR